MSAQQQVGALAEVPVDIEVELDRRLVTLGELAHLEVGSVVPLSRSAGENIDVLVGGVIIGFGEIVIIENTLGVRITDFNEEDD